MLNINCNSAEDESEMVIPPFIEKSNAIRTISKYATKLKFVLWEISCDKLMWKYLWQINGSYRKHKNNRGRLPLPEDKWV